jgi:hypothetical protein
MCAARKPPCRRSTPSEGPPFWVRMIFEAAPDEAWEFLSSRGGTKRSHSCAPLEGEALAPFPVLRQRPAQAKFSAAVLARECGQSPA